MCVSFYSVFLLFWWYAHEVRVKKVCKCSRLLDAFEAV